MTLMDSRGSFHFSDYLSQLPGNLVFERFVKRSDQSRRIVSATTIQDIKTRFASEKNLKETFSRLTKDAQYAVSLAYLFGRQGLPFECLQRPGIISGRKIEGVGVGSIKTGKDLLGFDDELISSFLVYAADDAQGKRYYLGFDEFEPTLRGILIQTIVEKIKAHSPKEAHYSAADLCVNDIAVVVALASQGKLTKTKTGHLSKVSETYLNSLLHASHSSHDYGSGSLRPVMLALEFACSQGLISLHEEHYFASHERMCAWASRTSGDLAREFVDFAFSSGRLWRRAMVHEMFSNPENPWLSSLAFGAELKNRVLPIIKLFAYFGLVDFYKSSGDFCFRGHSFRSVVRETVVKVGQAPGIMVLPDFTAMLPQEIAPELLYWFSKIGSLESCDKVYKGRITKEVLFDALSAGIEGGKILELLSRWHSSGNVMETVREWIREFSRVSMESGAFVLSTEEKVTKHLCSFGPLAGSLVPLHAHCIFKVVKGKEGAVAQILSGMGFDIRSPLVQHSQNAFDKSFGTEIPRFVDKEEQKLSPVYDFEEKDKIPDLLIQQGKYSSQLKALELTELIHVVDFSLLMGCSLRIEYSGSPGVRKGTYLVRPVHYQKSPDPLVEGEIGRAGQKKKFLLGRIAKIGVEPHRE
jgi:hypothetical protein